MEWRQFMNDQLTFFDISEFTEEIFIEKFDSSELNNEDEEDIAEIEKLDLSSMAITGTDWTTETIVSQIKKGNIVLDPDFQRREAWTNKTKSRFIESLFLGLPIPQIILAENKEKKGKFFVIDGKQRLISLKQFVLGKNDTSNNDQLRLFGLDVKKQFNQLTYEEIENSAYRDDIDIFNNQPIRTVVVKNWPAISVLYLLFLRLNTGSVRLSPQELRQALYPGEFIKYVNKCSIKNKELQKMLNISKPDFRMRDVEVLIRYYAFKYFISYYTGSMQKFLDDTCNKINNEWNERQGLIEKDYNEFSRAIKITRKIFDANAFTKYKNKKYENRYNRSVIDIMLFYFSQPKIQEKMIGKEKQIKKAFEELCTSNTDFLEAIELTTKSVFAVSTRFITWGKTLEQLLQIPIDTPKISTGN